MVGQSDQVWLATNGGPMHWDGSKWISGVQGMRAFTSLDLEVAPSAPSRVHLAAGRRGLFRSNDSGQTWVMAAATASSWPRERRWAPSSPAPRTGLYRLDLPASVAGAVWVPMTYCTGHQRIDAVAVLDPSTPYSMLVGTAGNGVLRLKRHGP